jgi:hypothetical protein
MEPFGTCAYVDGLELWLLDVTPKKQASSEDG